MGICQTSAVNQLSVISYQLSGVQTLVWLESKPLGLAGVQTLVWTDYQIFYQLKKY